MYRKGRASPPGRAFSQTTRVHNVGRRSALSRPRQFTIVVLLLVGLLLYRTEVQVPSFRLRGVFPTKNKVDACHAYSIERPFVPLNTTWRDVPVKHELGFLEMLSNTPAPLPSIQYRFPMPYEPTQVQQERQSAIKQSFVRTWTSYKQKAWMKDELKPLSGEFNDRYGGWAATLVDNLDTLWILGLTDEYEEAVNASVTIDFNDPEKLSMDDFSVFETTIRHLGGFLAAYELSTCKDVRLLDKATEIADMIHVAFDTDFHVPTNSWRPREGLRGEEQYPQEDDNILANVASLSMEFTRLSQLTGDMRYFTMIQGLTNRMEEQQPKTRLPGLWPHRYNARRFDFTAGSSFTLGAEADSAYEYLLKMVLLLGQAEPATQYKNMYNAAMDTAVDNLLYRPMTPTNADILLSGTYDVDDANGLRAYSEHLACFLGGMFALGGRALDNDDHVEIGRKLTEGCIWAYNATESGIAPEKFEMMKCDPSSQCVWNRNAWLERTEDDTFPEGMVAISDRRYHGRPEAVESVFYMYRITGEQKWQDIGWHMFEAIDSHTKTDYGNGRLQNVLNSHSAQEDFMESFWLAETLKYMYLLFSNPHHVSLDDYVFSTEAHPFKIPKP